MKKDIAEAYRRMQVQELLEQVLGPILHDMVESVYEKGRKMIEEGRSFPITIFAGRGFTKKTMKTAELTYTGPETEIELSHVDCDRIAVLGLGRAIQVSDTKGAGIKEEVLYPVKELPNDTQGSKYVMFVQGEDSCGNRYSVVADIRHNALQKRSSHTEILSLFPDVFKKKIELAAEKMNKGEK